MCIGIANREDPDQTASIWVCPVCLGLFSRQLVFKILEQLLYYYPMTYKNTTDSVAFKVVKIC